MRRLRTLRKAGPARPSKISVFGIFVRRLALFGPPIRSVSGHLGRDFFGHLVRDDENTFLVFRHLFLKSTCKHIQPHIHRHTHRHPHRHTHATTNRCYSFCLFCVVSVLGDQKPVNITKQHQHTTNHYTNTHTHVLFVGVV